MSYCLYVRKSRADAEAEARGEGETLARHVNTLLELAKKMNIEVTAIHREIVSGETIAARPVMQELLSEVEAGTWEGVLVMEIERLARGDTIDQGIVAQTFKYSDTKIITPMKIYDPRDEFDEEYFEFGLFMSRREYKTINRRLQRGRIASAAEGKYVAQSAPYGYERVKIKNDKGYTLAPIEDEAKAVKTIFELYVYGETLEDGSRRTLGASLIANKLNELKIPPRINEKWTAPSVRAILSNPVYTGLIRWNARKTEKKMVDGKLTLSRPKASEEEWLISEGLHPAIIDKELFEAAKRITEGNKKLPMKSDKSVKNALAGLVVCGKCGRKMIRRPYPDSSRDSLMCPYKTCNNVSSPLYIVEEHVIEFLELWLKEYQLQWSEKDEDGSDALHKAKEEALRKQREEKNALQKQLEKVYELFERGTYDEEEFRERSGKIKERINESIADIKRISAELTLEEMKKNERDIIIPKVEYILSVYETLTDPKDKNDLLCEVIEKIIYTKDKRSEKVKKKKKKKPKKSKKKKDEQDAVDTETSNVQKDADTSSKEDENASKETEWLVSPHDFELIVFPSVPSSTESSGDSNF